MCGWLVSRLNPWRFLLALVVLPCLAGTDSARVSAIQTDHLSASLAFDQSLLKTSRSSAVSAVSIQQRLLRYADLQGQSPHSEQGLFYTELFAQLPQARAVQTSIKTQLSILSGLACEGVIRAPPVLKILPRDNPNSKNTIREFA